jgi:hypothetical protein
MVEKISDFLGPPFSFSFPETTQIRIHHFSHVKGAQLISHPVRRRELQGGAYAGPRDRVHLVRDELRCN